MGSKSESKRLMEAAKVPLIPGYHGGAQTSAALSEAATRIGFPLLVFMLHFPIAWIVALVREVLLGEAATRGVSASEPGGGG